MKVISLIILIRELFMSTLQQLIKSHQTRAAHVSEQEFPWEKRKQK